MPVKSFKRLERAAPTILGQESVHRLAFGETVYEWKRGPVEVRIEWCEPMLGARGDWRVIIFFFRGHRDNDRSGASVSAWRSTPDKAAAYAERKLKLVLEALQ